MINQGMDQVESQQQEYMLKQKTNQLVRRLVDRFGQQSIHQISTQVSMVPRHILINKPLDFLERDLHVNFGHWSRHVGNETPSPPQYIRSGHGKYSVDYGTNSPNRSNSIHKSTTVQGNEISHEEFKSGRYGSSIDYQQQPMLQLGSNLRNQQGMLSPMAQRGQNIMGNNMTPTRQIPNQYGSPDPASYNPGQNAGVNHDDIQQHLQQYNVMGENQSKIDTSSQMSSGRNHKNIRFKSNMDEWSILARLQDYEAEKIKQSEMEKYKKKQQDVKEMLQKQKMEQGMAQDQKNQQNRMMDRKMIELDLQLKEQDNQKIRDRDEQNRRIRRETLEQELQLKQMANYKKSDHAKAEAEADKVAFRRQQEMYEQKLADDKVRRNQNKIKWQEDLNYQNQMKNQQKQALVNEDNEFQKLTMEKDQTDNTARVLRHKNLMDKYLGDYDNQKGVIRKALYEQMQEKYQKDIKDKMNDQVYVIAEQANDNRLKRREDAEKDKRLQQKTLLKSTLEQQMQQNSPQSRHHGYQVQGMSGEEKKINKIKIQQLLNQFQDEYGQDAELNAIMGSAVL